MIEQDGLEESRLFQQALNSAGQSNGIGGVRYVNDFWNSPDKLDEILKVCTDYSVSEIQFPGGPLIKFSADFQRMKIDAIVRAAAEVSGETKGSKRKTVTDDEILQNPTAGLNLRS